MDSAAEGPYKSEAVGERALFRLLFRFIGLMSLASAFAAAVIDGARTLADQQLELTPLGVPLAYVMKDRFAALQELVSRISPKIGEPVLLSVLYAPTFVALAVVGFALMAITRRRQEEPIGARRA